MASTQFNTKGHIAQLFGVQNNENSVVNQNQKTYIIMDGRQRLSHQSLKSPNSSDDAILASLAFPEMTHRRRNVNRPYHKTCQWIFRRKEYRNWVAQHSSLLWIKGKPGSGKSTLMSHIYEATYPKDTDSTSSDIYLDFFFTARGGLLQRSPIGMFRCLLYQIFNRDPEVRGLLRKLFQEKLASVGNARCDWQRPELERLLTDMVLASAQTRQITILVDALDEAGERDAHDIARYFHTLMECVQEQSGRAKICISCRHYPVAPSCGGANDIIVEKYNRKDIASFITSFVKGYIDMNGDTSERWRWQMFLDQLTHMANGVFQWAQLVMPLLAKRIGDGDSPHEIQQLLPQISTELDQVYGLIFEQLIDSGYRMKSLHLFQWVCLATRPLTLLELKDALAALETVTNPPPYSKVSADSGYDLTEKRFRDRIQAWSGGLLEWVYGHGESVPGNFYDAHVLQPIHLSVNDFLLNRGFNLLTLSAVGKASPRIPFTTIASTDISGATAKYHGELYWTCLDYLAGKTAELSLLATVRTLPIFRQDQLLSKIELAKYACSNVMIHAEKAPGSRGRGLEQEVELLTRALPAWVTTWEMYNSHSNTLKHGATPLHVTAVANMTDLAVYLLQHGASVSAVDKDKQTALHLAASHGHYDIVKLLVGAGADVQASTISRETALTLTAAGGHERIFSFLLKNGADIAGSTSDGSNALHKAAWNGKAAIVRLCIAAGADVNAQGGRCANALQAASSSRSSDTVRILLEAGADVHAQGGIYFSALQAASVVCNGNKDIVHLLLEAGADVNIQGGNYGNALQAASTFCNAEIVKILLEAGADIHATGGKCYNALHAASFNGHVDVIRILLAAGADVNAQGGDYNTALAAALTNDVPEAIRLLREAEARINADGGKYNDDALDIASRFGVDEIKELPTETWHTDNPPARKPRKKRHRKKWATGITQ